MLKLKLKALVTFMSILSCILLFSSDIGYV